MVEKGQTPLRALTRSADMRLFYTGSKARYTRSQDFPFGNLPILLEVVSQHHAAGQECFHPFTVTVRE